MIVADAEGRRSARESVAIIIAKQTSSGGYFKVDDLSADGVKVDVAGHNATIENYPQELVGNELFVRADVLQPGRVPRRHGQLRGGPHMYDKASSMGGQGWYSEARAACARRLADSQALED